MTEKVESTIKEEKGKKTRRTNGRGSIYKKGKKWIGQCCIGKTEEGKRQFIKKTFEKKADAEEWLDETRLKKGSFRRVSTVRRRFRTCYSPGSISRKMI